MENIESDISNKENLLNYNNFFDKKYLDPFINGYAVIFITKPTLFINSIPSESNNLKKLAYKNMAKDPVFAQYLAGNALNSSDKIIPAMLSYFDSDQYNSNFLKIFTNNFLNFDPQDISLEENDFFDTKEGYKFPLPISKTVSVGTGNISIQVNETGNLDFTKIMTLWVNYIANITDGTFDANPNMVSSGDIDYMSSLFYFVLEPDGRTLKYWEKYTGIWPTNIPAGSFKYSRGAKDIAALDINFVYTSKEIMNPEILIEFNKISLNLINDTRVNRISNSLNDSDEFNVKTNVFLNKAAFIKEFSDIDLINNPSIFLAKSNSSENDSTYKFVLNFEANNAYKRSFQYKNIDSNVSGANKYYYNYEEK